MCGGWGIETTTFLQLCPYRNGKYVTITVEHCRWIVVIGGVDTQTAIVEPFT
jgi:hypothetical protein